MSHFGIPDRDAEIEALAITAETRAEAWAIAAEQAISLPAIRALEDRLHRRLELLRTREQPADIERIALAALAARRSEILACPDPRT
jgi:hypothetical protein